MTPGRGTSRRRKALGQHFLRNAEAAAALVAGLAPRPGEPILEIGPGRGALTGRLLKAGARVVAVERDARLAQALAGRLGSGAGSGGRDASARLDLHVADARKADLSALLRPHLTEAFPKARVLANLPYSVGTEILARLLLASDLLSEVTLMLQREVADRVCATPGSRVYGSLSVLAQYFTEPRCVMRLSPGSFEPRPKVHSAVVVMPFRHPRELDPERERAYPPFIRSLFHQRRRTLPHNLVPAWGRDREAIAARLAALGIDPARRPETLTREECLAIFAASAAPVPPPPGPSGIMRRPDREPA